MKITIQLVLLLLICSLHEVIAQESGEYEAEYTVTLTGETLRPISNHLMGFNLVYSQESDQIWQDGKVEGYLKDVNTSLLRWPGGTISTFYHWNDLTGKRPPWRDNWDPDNNVSVAAESEFMDLDEYISLIKSTGATPLLGINVDSGRRWDREQDGIDEALALMQYCKDNDFDVTYWYLGNEAYHNTSNGGEKTAQQYANLINTYANAMREIDPDIKVVANWISGMTRSHIRSDYQTLMNIAGDNIDIIDTHHYWSFSGPSMENWLQHTPMRVFTGKTYIEEIAYFHEMMTDFGHPDTQLAALEWNVGPINNQQLNPHQVALMQSEMMMEFLMGGMDFATFWPIQWPSGNVTRRTLIDRYNNNEAQPNLNLFRFFGQFQGGEVVKDHVTKSSPNILQFAAKDQQENVLRIAFLNKNTHGVKATMNAMQIGDAILQSAQAYILTDGGDQHEVNSIDLLEHGADGISFVAQPLSLTMLTFDNITLTSMEETGKNTELPENYKLHQNFPNPFNPSTEISYQLSTDSDVNFEVFNMLGQRVANLVNQRQAAGVHRITFDASELPSGIYFYRLKAGTFMDSKKMMLMK
ncbi:MAG: T9SS type A sorting domain-containing protein [Balneolales bacterium]